MTEHPPQVYTLLALFMGPKPPEFRSQLPVELLPAYDIALANKLLSQVGIMMPSDEVLLITQKGRGALATHQLQPTQASAKPKGKSGRKSNKEQDAKIVREYHDGLEHGLWKNAAEYVRKKHPKRSEAWFSQVRKRIENLKKSNDV